MLLLLFVKQLSLNSNNPLLTKYKYCCAHGLEGSTNKFSKQSWHRVPTTFASLYLGCPVNQKNEKNSPNPRQGNFPEFFLGIPYISCYLAQSIKYIYTLTGMSFDHFLCLLCNYIKAIMLHDLELNKCQLIKKRKRLAEKFEYALWNERNLCSHQINQRFCFFERDIFIYICTGGLTDPFIYDIYDKSW